MSIIEATDIGLQQPAVTKKPAEQTLRDSVDNAMKNYFSQLGGQSVTNIYEMVISEVEIPLLQAVMQHTRGNQSKAAILLGISRGTLRKKLKQYGIEKLA